MIHELEIRREFADAVLSGEKTFEIRFNDRGFQKGDLVRFHVESAATIYAGDIELNPNPHPIEEEVFEITYVLNGWALENGYVVFGIRREAGDGAS